MLWRSFKKSCFFDEIKLLFYFAAILTVLRLLGVSCLLYRITSFPCPACHMTRALLSLIKGDIAGYVSYNVMALPVATVFVGEVFSKHYGKYEKFVHIYSVIILTINLIYYANRIILR